MLKLTSNLALSRYNLGNSLKKKCEIESGWKKTSILSGSNDPWTGTCKETSKTASMPSPMSSPMS